MEIIILIEISQWVKDKYHMTSVNEQKQVLLQHDFYSQLFHHFPCWLLGISLSVQVSSTFAFHSCSLSHAHCLVAYASGLTGLQSCGCQGKCCWHLPPAPWPYLSHLPSTCLDCLKWARDMCHKSMVITLF